jgi:dihydroxyacetone kinase-like predicted kinase
VLSAAQCYGEFLTLKIENMSLGHSGAAAKPKTKVSKKYSTIAVATGEGMCALFTELGADMIVNGGQTANPSTEEFIEAFESCNSEHIIVLPNNKNVFLAAEQAGKIYDKAKVHIIPTASICEGYGALSVITPGISDVDMLVENINRAIKGIVGGEITCAVRDVTLGGKKVKKGDYIAISEKEIKAVAETPEEAVVGLLSSIDMDEYEIVTLFVGKSVSEEKRAELTELLEDEYPDCEIVVYEGGQDVYDYLVAIE